MTVKLAIMTVSALALTGCATVDIASMGGTSAPSARATQAPVVNVVQRAASRLYTAFTSNGWTQKSSRKRVQSTANVLLKGLRPQTEAQEAGLTLDGVSSVSALEAELRMANRHVVQTTKAAEVYLSMAGDASDVKAELRSLEQALIAARQAEIVFTQTLKSFSSDTCDGLAVYSANVDALVTITDRYGDRVRGQATQVSAATLG